MKRIFAFGVVFCAAVPWLMSGPAAHANGSHVKRGQVTSHRVVKPRSYGYVVWPGGGYSYTFRDVINTYRSPRTKWGSTNFYRNWRVDRQTEFGPFDHGFFFDSPVAPNAGYAPYQH